MDRRLWPALGLLPLGVGSLAWSLVFWAPCSNGLTSQCNNAISASAWPTAFVNWFAALAATVWSLRAPKDRYATIPAFLLALFALFPALDRGFGEWDTADTIPYTGVMSSIWCAIVGVVLTLPVLVDAYRARRARAARRPPFIRGGR